MTNSANGIISYIGIGSNLEKPVDNCLKATEYLGSIKSCKVLHRSSFYRTEPVGYLNQEWFINAVVEIRTGLTAWELFQELQRIENLMGRQKLMKWGPRIIDLDILFYGQGVINEDHLTVPHPELHRRRFVLEPLYEIAPYMIHPAFGVSIAGLMERLEDPSSVERIELESKAV